ncbi:MAG: DegT/DnrJ/EryC1/StrS family aminotransferase [Bacteroidales bacterium]|nr:DegT/DnrJ/EryC1/StrS family aminotransferase [Bacteroidales bacterium]MBN2757958.1 DegT/DnrJ/EryC1/StrS family aminotransferase [Bacteroidales bacterium]
MEQIMMVDLHSQYQKIKEEIDREIFSVIESTQFINGPSVKTFQDNFKNYIKAKHVITCGNGTDALQIAMMALGLKPGDEVITADFTFVATVEVIALLGLKPVLVDVDSETFTIDIEKLKAAITPKTKAIVPVHLFGQAANMKEIVKIAKQHNLYIIEDTAQAIGAEYTFENDKVKKLGTIGDIGCTSFFPSKNLGCFGDGGAIFTNNDEYAEKLHSIVNHGMKVRYYHDNVGVNSRLDTIQAAILNVKLKYLDNYNMARQNAAEYYNNAFKNFDKLQTPVVQDNSTHCFHQYTLVTKNIDRDKLREYLNSKEIPAMVYYPVPLHLQKAYKDDRYKKGDFPVTEMLSKSVISLPMHTELEKEQQDYIIECVLDFINE